MVLRRSGLSTEPDAGDVVSEVVWRAYVAARRDRPATPRALRSLTSVIAQRAAAEWLEKRARFQRGARDLVVPSGEGEIEARDMLAKLREATTPERWRIVLAVASGEEMAEIAKREGIGLNTASNRLRLARRDFARMLARERAKSG